MNNFIEAKNRLASDRPSHSDIAHADPIQEDQDSAPMVSSPTEFDALKNLVANRQSKRSITGTEPTSASTIKTIDGEGDRRRRMKKLGLIGGMSWESTVTYYQLINRRVRECMGGLHSAECIVYSFDFAEIERLQTLGKWEEAGMLIGDAAKNLQGAGADAIVICSNTMHKLSSYIEQSSTLPLLHIADATAERISMAGFQRVGLLGTRYTMEQEFYKERLKEKHGLTVLIPCDQDRLTVNTVIYEELCNGVIREDSRNSYKKIVDDLGRSGAQCVILGCTEIGLLMCSDDVKLPLFDTTAIHAEAAADWAMKTVLETMPESP